jgi:hypothetical protein
MPQCDAYGQGRLAPAVWFIAHQGAAFAQRPSPRPFSRTPAFVRSRPQGQNPEDSAGKRLILACINGLAPRYAVRHAASAGISDFNMS